MLVNQSPHQLDLLQWMMGEIQEISGFWANLNHPTIEVEVLLEDGSVGRAAVPSGSSTGSREARELRDTDSPRFGGKGVLHAVRNVDHTLATLLKGEDARYQRDIDHAMIEKDGVLFYGTKNDVLLAVDSKAGKLKWQHKLGSGVMNTVVPLSAKFFAARMAASASSQKFTPCWAATNRPIV